MRTPLSVLRGGSDQEMTATSEVMDKARTFSGGWLGTARRGEKRRARSGRCQATCVCVCDPGRAPLLGQGTFRWDMREALPTQGETEAGARREAALHARRFG